jgi:hypothetical protein
VKTKAMNALVILLVGEHVKKYQPNVIIEQPTLLVDAKMDLPVYLQFAILMSHVQDIAAPK